MFCILCSLVQTYHLYLSVLCFFFWIPVFEQFDQGSCFGTVMFETCPTSGIYKFLITISIVSLHMTVSSLISWRINPVGFSLNLKKKEKEKTCPFFCMFSLPFFPIRNVFYMQALLPGCPWHQVRHFSTQISYSSLKYQFEPFKIPCIYLLNMIHVDFSLWTFQVHLSQLYNSLFQEFKVCINSELDLMILFLCIIDCICICFHARLFLLNARHCENLHNWMGTVKWIVP